MVSLVELPALWVKWLAVEVVANFNRGGKIMSDIENQSQNPNIWCR
jgi:hypothetical protein